jgi:Spy/CpxP family protein refolding chaperone
MKRIVAVALGLLLVLGVSSARADINVGDGTDTAMLRQAVKTDRRALVAATITLTNAEAKKFWPIYESYQRAMDVINRQRNVSFEALLAYDKPMSNLAARNLARDLLAQDEAEVRAKRKMFNAVMRALPALKAARYVQLEAKISAIQAYDIAAAFPLIK